MAIVFSGAEAINQLWSVAASQAHGTVQERVSDLAFRRNVLAVAKRALDSSQIPSGRALAALLDDQAFIAFAIEPTNRAALDMVPADLLRAAFGGDPTDAYEAASVVASTAVALALGGAELPTRILDAKLSELTQIGLQQLSYVVDIFNLVDASGGLSHFEVGVLT